MPCKRPGAGGLDRQALWVLLPDPHPPLSVVVASFAVAQIAGAVSHLPGGIGVFEALMALAAFRALYCVAPFTLAAIAVAAYEGWRGRHHAYDRRSRSGCRGLTPRLDGSTP